jgi:hypothetical protein
MNINQIRQHAQSTPFRPFTIELVNGESLLIEESRQIHVSPYKPYLITIFTKDGLAHLFEPGSLIKIAA